MISALEALNNHRYTYFGFESHPTEKDPWQATPTMAYSDNLVNWETVGAIDGLGELRDGFMKKISDYYYVIGTGGFYKTTDFIGFEKLAYLDTSKYKNVWAPEIFEDTKGKYHIMYCAGDSDKGIIDDYVADFDPSTDTISNQDQAVSFMKDAIDNTYRIDPDICLIDGVYFLTIGGNYVFSSNDYLGPYQRFPVNFAPTPQKFNNHNSSITGWVEGPNMFVDGDSVRLFADQADGNGLVFRSAVLGDMFDWSRTEKTHAPFKMRHGSIIVNEQITAQVPAEIDNEPKLDTHMTIQALHSNQQIPLTCYIKSSFQVQYEDNQTNQLQFVAYDDGTPSYSAISNESVISFNNDLYVIKNTEGDYTGTGLVTVTAIQFVNSEIGRVYQKNVRQGTLTYTVSDVLDFFLNDKTANPFGFSYHVFGDFDKQQIENLGGCSGKDMISKIISTWPGAIVNPVGKRVDVYAPDVLHQNRGRRIVYHYNSSNMKLTTDSTVIVNQITCVGGSYSDSDVGGGTSTPSSDNSGVEVTDGTQTIVTGQDDTTAFQNDAKKYLGVPYVWGGAGGARGGNPFSGMDCSSYVSQVYQDFGIHIPAQTVAMESSFREIPYSEAKAGDVGFYGPHGGTHHISLLLDHDTQIYEPEPGESCKIASIASFPPTWYGRNDAMQAKINTKKVEEVPTETVKLVDTYVQGSYTPDTTSDQTHYYFQPFTITDERSKDEWGLYPANAPLQDDRFKDPTAMERYARTQLVLDPAVSIEVVMDTNEVPVQGEQRYLTIPSEQTMLGEASTSHANNYVVTLVGYTWYPFNPAQGTDLTFDNLPASLLHANNRAAELSRLEQLANQMFDRMPQVFYSNQDPSANQKIRNGAIWIKPIEYNGDNSDDMKNGGETNGGK